jgi:hypothetical protein
VEIWKEGERERFGG